MYQQTQTMTTGHTNFMTIMFFILLFLGAPTMAAGRDITGYSLVKFSTSDDDLRRVAGYGEDKLSMVVVGGSVLCDACLGGNSPPHPHPVPGATMAVSCHTSRKTSKSDWVRGTTNEYGDFLVDLPSHLHAVPNMEKRCIVTILRLPKSSPCHQALTGEYNGIKLSSVVNGFRTYTAHEIHLRPNIHRHA